MADTFTEADFRSALGDAYADLVHLEPLHADKLQEDRLDVREFTAPPARWYTDDTEIDAVASAAEMLCEIITLASDEAHESDRLLKQAADRLMFLISDGDCGASGAVLSDGFLRCGSRRYCVLDKDADPESIDDLLEYDASCGHSAASPTMVWATLDDDLDHPAWPDLIVTRGDFLQAFEGWKNELPSETCRRYLRQLVQAEGSANSWRHLPMRWWNMRAWSGFFVHAKRTGLLADISGRPFRAPDLARATERKQDLACVMAAVYDDPDMRGSRWLGAWIFGIDLEIRGNTIVVCAYTHPKQLIDSAERLPSLACRRRNADPSLRSAMDRIHGIFREALGDAAVRTEDRLLMGLAIDVVKVEYDPENYEDVLRKAVAAASELARLIEEGGPEW